MQVLVRDNNVDQALKALKKKMQREGIFREMKLRGHYEKPSEKRAREKAEAVRRARKLARKKMQREGLLPMKPKPVFGAGPGGERGAGGGRGGPGGGPRGPPPGPPRPPPPAPRSAPGPAPNTGFGFIGSRPSRCSFLRASLRARRTASAFSRAFFSEGFS